MSKALKTLLGVCAKEPAERDPQEVAALLAILADLKVDQLLRQVRQQFVNSEFCKYLRLKNLKSGSVLFNKGNYRLNRRFYPGHHCAGSR
jgi:hypothetical protein